MSRAESGSIVDEVIDMHAEQLAIFGGPEGLRDRGLLRVGG